MLVCCVGRVVVRVINTSKYRAQELVHMIHVLSGGCHLTFPSLACAFKIRLLNEEIMQT